MIPNLLSISRIIFAVGIFFLSIKNLPLLILFAGLTDFLDGYLARKLNQLSKLGTILDPLADKVFLNALLILFYTNNLLEGWIVAIFLLKDALLILFFLPLRNTTFEIKPILASKLSTALLFLASIFISLHFTQTALFIFYAALALTIYSFIIYAFYAIRYNLGG